MAQCGCFVPAKECFLSIIHSLHVRLRTPESVMNSLTSAFANDLAQVGSALRSYINTDAVENSERKKNSLILLDEFGKGTDEASGCALLAACIEFWILNKNLGNVIVFSISHMQNVFKRFKDNQLFKSNLFSYRAWWFPFSPAGSRRFNPYCFFFIQNFSSKSNSFAIKF